MFAKRLTKLFSEKFFRLFSFLKYQIKIQKSISSVLK